VQNTEEEPEAYKGKSPMNPWVLPSLTCSFCSFWKNTKKGTRKCV